jgi:hypothetical protein
LSIIEGIEIYIWWYRVKYEKLFSKTSGYLKPSEIRRLLKVGYTKGYN